MARWERVGFCSEELWDVTTNVIAAFMLFSNTEDGPKGCSMMHIPACIAGLGKGRTEKETRFGL